MRDEAIAAYPVLDGRLVEGALPDALPDLAGLGSPFDGVLCSAVLQHLPRAQLFDAVYEIRKLLRPGGRALVSVPTRRPDIGPDSRDPYGRLFEMVPAGELALLFERVGFRIVERWEDHDSLARADTSWATFLFERLGDTDGANARPLDRLEAVLRRDRMVATYKFALLRALVDIAANRPRQVSWRNDGAVAVPIDAIAEQWIIYYWPLFESSTFLPQMNGEAATGTHKLSFAAELDALRARYARAGGLPAFLVDWHGGRFAEKGQEAAGELHCLVARMRTAIRSGPVHYAGRSTSGASTFGFDAGTRHVLIDEALWREISLMGHWIRDSLLVRWAELTARLADTNPNTASRDSALQQSLAVLLTPPAPERDTQIARQVYAAVPRGALRCVWSDHPLINGRFDVDHAIPFGLWRSNDLWNLLPASPSVNLRKSDRLPSRALLRERRSAIVDSWSRLRDAFPRRFAAELGRLAGDAGNDFATGFEALCEAVEITALQRGCERWTTPPYSS